MADKPRLKQGETVNSPSFQKRMRDYQRQLALEEATRMQQEQNKEEAAKNAERDVVAEVRKGVEKADEESARERAKAKAPEKKAPEKKAPPRRALRDRQKTIDEQIEAAGG